MKKSILLLLFICFSNILYSQTYTHNTRVKIKNTPTAVANDTILAIDTEGLIKKTLIPVSNLLNPSFAFEAIDEGNGIGYIPRNRDSNNFGPVGEGSLDLTASSSPSTERGIKGASSIGIGFDIVQSGQGNLIIGGFIESSGNYNTAIGTGINLVGDALISLGGLNTINGIASSIIGQNGNNDRNYSHLIGTGLVSNSDGGVFVGQANEDIADTNANDPNGIMFDVGNGDINIINGSATSRSSAFKVFKNGKIIAPDLSLANIDSNSSLITKEYFDTNVPTISPNTAFTNVDNNFSVDQTINGNINISEGSSYLQDGSNVARIAKTSGSIYTGTFIGDNAGNTSSTNIMTAVGSYAGYNNSGEGHTSLGSSAGINNTGTDQTAIGVNSGSSNSGINQTAVGGNSGNNNSGNFQTAVGNFTGNGNTGDNQTAVGYNSGRNNVSANQTAIGSSAGINNTGTNQTAIGSSAGNGNTGDNQTAIGISAGLGNSGNNNIFIGHTAGLNNTIDNRLEISHSISNSTPIITGNLLTNELAIGGETELGKALKVYGDGMFTGLSGSGDRMVIANADGTLSTQAIPSGSDPNTAFINVDNGFNVNQSFLSGIQIIDSDLQLNTSATLSLFHRAPGESFRTRFVPSNATSNVFLTLPSQNGTLAIRNADNNFTVDQSFTNINVGADSDFNNGVVNANSFVQRNVYDVDFTEATYAFITAWNGATRTFDTVNERLEVTSNSADRGFQITGLEDNTEYVITIDIDLNGVSSIGFYNRWANRLETITESGTHAIRFLNEQSGVFPDPIFAFDEAGTFYVNDLKVAKQVVWATPLELNQVAFSFDLTGGNFDDRLQIGNNANSPLDKQTVTGSYATSDQQEASVYGYNANGNHFGFYGAQNANELALFGDNSRGGGWRTTGFGSKTFPLGQSSTAISTGAEVTTTHGLAIGRGALLHYLNNANVIGGVGNTDLFIGTGWAHRFRMPFSGISAGENNTDQNIKISGINAFDARPYQYSASDTYSLYDEVVSSTGQLYVSKVNNNQGNPLFVEGIPIDEDANWKNITSLLIGHTLYYPPNPSTIWESVQAFSAPYTGEIGTVVSDGGSYYIRQSETDNNTTPASNSDFIDITPSYNVGNTRVEADYFNVYNPSSYDIGEITVKWETIFVSKVNGNTTIPNSDRTSSTEWEAVVSPRLSALWVGMANVSHYDTRHDFEVKGGNLYLDAGKGTKTASSGEVHIRTRSQNLSGVDNVQNSLNSTIVVGTDRIIANAPLIIAGGILQTASDQTIPNNITYVGVTDTSSVRTLTISSELISIEGYELTIKDQSFGAGTNNIVIQTEGSELIENLNTISITGNGGFVNLKAIGGSLYIVK